MKKKKLNKNWLHDHINDPYVKAAQKDGYRARAAYKLKEIDEDEHLVKPGQVIVDLGCTPGSWGQYVRRKLAGKDGGGINGTMIGLDMLPMEPIADVHFILGDFRELETLEQLGVVLQGRKCDLVLSDMAPNTVGHRETDHLRIVGLIELAAAFAIEVLKPGGSFVAKAFQGGETAQIIRDLKKHFNRVQHVKPKASRADSSEVFLVATGFKR